jgi:signal peptidase I
MGAGSPASGGEIVHGVDEERGVGRTPLVRAARVGGRIATVGGLIATIGVLGLFVACRAAGYQTLIVRSGSMTGTADTGSLVLARPIEPTAIERGDVIVVRPEDDGTVHPPVLHRVIERDLVAGEVVVRTKGDANAFADPTPYLLKGPTLETAYVIPKAGFAVAVLQTPSGWIGLVVLPLVMATLRALRRIWRRHETPALELVSG